MRFVVILALSLTTALGAPAKVGLVETQYV